MKVFVLSEYIKELDSLLARADQFTLTDMVDNLEGVTTDLLYDRVEINRALVSVIAELLYEVKGKDDTAIEERLKLVLRVLRAAKEEIRK